MTKDFKIEIEWEDPQAARGEELRATWSRLRILIDGNRVTQVLDEKSESVRDAVYLPAYPLAEWLAFHWWPMMNEAGSGDPSANGEFKKRHNLKFAAEGFALPDLSFVTDGGAVYARWTPYAPEASPAKFLSGGTAVIDQAAFQHEITRFVQTVLARLSAKGIENSTLAAEWDAIQSVDYEEAEFCRAAGSLGVDPFDLSDKVRNQICEAGIQIPQQALEEFFQAADPEHLRSNVDWILRTIEVLHSSLTRYELPKRFSPKFPRSGEAWKEGYKLARETRRSIGLIDWAEPVHWGLLAPEASEGFPICPEQPTLRTDAVSFFGANSTAAIVMVGGDIFSKRFLVARALCDYVISGIDVPLLLTRSGTRKQRRNRAFAAEFLAPWEGIRSCFKGNEADYRVIAELAIRFQVGELLIKHQLENHKIRVLSQYW